MTSVQFKVGDLIRLRDTDSYTWRVEVIYPNGYIKARDVKCPSVVRIILWSERYEKVEL